MGFGKTTIGYSVAYEMLNKGIVDKVCVIVPNSQLCNNWYREAKLIGIESDVSSYYDTIQDFKEGNVLVVPEKPIIIYSTRCNFSSKCEHLMKERNNMVLYIIDEAHEYNDDDDSFPETNDGNKALYMSANMSKDVADIYVERTLGKIINYICIDDMYNTDEENFVEKPQKIKREHHAPYLETLYDKFRFYVDTLFKDTGSRAYNPIIISNNLANYKGSFTNFSYKAVINGKSTKVRKFIHYGGSGKFFFNWYKKQPPNSFFVVPTKIVEGLSFNHSNVIIILEYYEDISRLSQKVGRVFRIGNEFKDIYLLAPHFNDEGDVLFKSLDYITHNYSNYDINS